MGARRGLDVPSPTEDMRPTHPRPPPSLFPSLPRPRPGRDMKADAPLFHVWGADLAPCLPQSPQLLVSHP